jgi:hypothetical protein
MRSPDEIKIELEEAQKVLIEADKFYKQYLKAASMAPGNVPRQISIKEIRPVHDKLAKARDIVRALQKELRRAEGKKGPDQSNK